MVDTGYFGDDRARRMQREQVQSRWMRAYEPIRHLDPILVGTALVLTGIGLALIFSATTTRVGETGAPDLSLVMRQVVAFGVGIVAMVVMSILDYRWIRALAPVLYGGSIILLVAVLHPAVGTLVNGSRRWINIGGFSLQPSELAKIAVIVAVAALLHERRGEVLEFLRQHHGEQVDARASLQQLKQLLNAPSEVADAQAPGAA